MKQSTQILDQVKILDNLKTIDGFKKDGGAQSKIKEKQFGDKLVVMKKKKESESNSTDMTKLFFREVINQILTEHPAVLPVCGWNFYHYSDKNKMFVYRHSIITSFCDGGTLGSYLLQMKENGMLEPRRIQTQQYIFAYGIAKAMEYLYRIGIIHRDLKTENIFVTSPKWENKNIPEEIKPFIDNGYYIPLLADLGFAKRTNEDDEMSNQYGTPLYEAPEQLKSYTFSFPADVYGYGITLSDIFQLRKVVQYPDVALKNFQTFYRYVKKGNKPNLAECSKNQLDLLDKLLNFSPKNRPNFIQIADYLETPLKENAGYDQSKFIFDNFDLDVMKAYRNYIYLLQNHTDEELYILQNNSSYSSIKTENISTTINTKTQNLQIPDYASSFINSFSFDSKPNEFYYKEGLQYESQGDYQNAISAYMRATIYGSLESITKLGILLLKNSSQEKQIQGFNLLKLAADYKEKDGLYSFAYLLTEGFTPKSLEPDLKTSAKLFIQAANLGHPKGWFMAGDNYHRLAIEENEKGHIENAKKNLEVAKDCYQKSFQLFDDKKAESLFNDISKYLEK